MDWLLPHLNVLVLFMSGVGVAVVLFVAIGLLLDVVPREAEKPHEASSRRGFWLWRFLHLGSSN